MTINIRAVGIELTPAIRQYAEEKFETLEKFAHKIMQIDLDIGMETQHHNKGQIYSCAAVIQIPGDVIKVERTADDLYKAIDKVKDHLRETLSQLKDKRTEARQAGDLSTEEE